MSRGLVECRGAFSAPINHRGVNDNSVSSPTSSYMHVSHVDALKPKTTYFPLPHK